MPPASAAYMTRLGVGVAEQVVGDRVGEDDRQPGADDRDDRDRDEAGAEAAPRRGRQLVVVIVVVVVVLVVAAERPLQRPLLAREREEERQQAREEEQQAELAELARARRSWR